MQINKDEVFNKTFWRNLATIAGGLVLYVLMQHFKEIVDGVVKFARLLAPFAWGFVFAFLLNGMMMFFEKKSFATIKERRVRRAWSLTTTLVICLGVIVVLFSFMIPQLGASIASLGNKLPEYAKTLQAYLNGIFPSLEISSEVIMRWFNSLFSADSVSTIFSYSGQVAGTVLNMFIGLVVAVYLLFNKEKYSRQAKGIAYALFPDVWVYRLLKIIRYAHRTFTGFFYSKLLDSLAVGVICFVGMMFFGMSKYALLISVIVGLTNIIPFFGPFIGAVPAIIILLAESPVQAFEFAVFILVLQQFDGNIMGPRIMQNSIGLPAIWVMFAILVGGGLFGFAGMIMGIPVFAMLYEMFDEWLKARQNEKRVLEKSGV